MGIIKKMKNALGTKAEGALGRATDPKKELETILLDLERQRDVAIRELLSYKTTAKQMEQSLEGHQKRRDAWEKRAMLAVKTGDDETAKECLRRRRECESEIANIERDQREAATYAAELNASRKKAEVKLRSLKLRKGTLATQLAAARSGGDVFGGTAELFDRLEAAEEKIDAELFEQEAASELLEEKERDAELAAKFDALSSEGVPEDPDDPLVALKRTMAEKKLLK